MRECVKMGKDLDKSTDRNLTGGVSIPIKQGVDNLLSRNDIEIAIFQESIDKISEIFGSKLEFSFICGGLANGYWQNSHDIDFFVCINGPMTQNEEINYLTWYFDIHNKFGLTPDNDYPGEIIEKDNLIARFGKLHNLNLQLNVSDIALKKAIIWCDMLTSNIKGVCGNNIELLELLRGRYCNEPDKWKDQLLKLIPESEVEEWKDKSHTLIMEEFMKYPKGDGRSKRSSGYLNKSNDYLGDSVIEAEKFEPMDWCENIFTQIEKLTDIYPTIKINEEYLNERLNSKLIEGKNRIAIPKITFLSEIYGVSDGLSEIGLLIEETTKLLEKDRPFTNYRKGELTSDKIIVDEENSKKRNEFESKIIGDILILDVDLGTEYTGFSPRRAKSDINGSNNKIALTSSDIALILLLNPNRLKSDIDLSIDSVAETYFSETRGWTSGLFYYFRKSNGELSTPVKNLEFGYRWNKRVYSDSGSAYFVVKC